MHHTVRRRTALAALALTTLSPLAQAQAPAANVRLLVGYAAGGPVDAVARIFAPALAKELEEAELFREMQADIVAQVLRRLAAVVV